MWDIVAELAKVMLPLLTAFAGWAAAGLKRNQKEMAAIKNGVKGLLRAKVIDLGLHYIEAQAIPPYGLETLHSCYDPYMALGDGDPSVTHIMKKCEGLPVRPGGE